MPARKHVVMVPDIGDQVPIPLIMAGVNYKDAYPKIERVRFVFNYGWYFGAQCALAASLQTLDGAPVDPDSPYLICRAVQGPSVIDSTGNMYFDSSANAFTETAGRAPIAAKQLFLVPFGAVPAPLQVWVEILYEPVALTDTKKALLLFGQM